MNADTPQLTLSIALSDEARFANFLDGDNQAVVQALHQQVAHAQHGFIYLWGASGSGCSHLLQSVCHLATQQSLSHVYFPLAELVEYGPSVLDGLEQQALVTLDDLDVIAGRPEWEEAVFHLFNRILGTGHRLLVASHHSPASLGIQLPDLASRLRSGVVLQVHTLDDEQLLEALLMRSHSRGLILESDSARFILRRCQRSTHQLFQLLDQLDAASLSAQRKLTIPFIKQTLGW